MPEETANSSSSSASGATTGPGGSSALLCQEGKHGNEPANGDAASARKHLPDGSPLAGLPMQLDATVPIPRFRVQDLLALEKGAVLETHWQHTEDVPVWCGGAQLVWTEFEVVDQKLAVRVTRLA